MSSSSLQVNVDSSSASEPAPAAARSPHDKRVLVFNFFSGVKERGIQIYTREILEALRRSGVTAIELRCPHWLRRVPAPILHLIYVLFEQLVAPFVRVIRNCTVTIYPGNSAGIIDALLGRSIVIIHDLISNHKRRQQLSARYVRVTQAIHRLLGRTVCAASLHTLSQLRRLRVFARCPMHMWSNPFYGFEAASAATQPISRRHHRLRVLLCTGMGPNKDYAGAINLFRHSRVLADADLRIVGFGGEASLAQRRIDRLPGDVRDRITVLPRLTLEELAIEYHASDVVWVHSLKEGYGRSVVEARIASRPVIASHIGSFRSLRWLDITLYRRNNHDFDTQLKQLLATPPQPFRRDVLEEFHRSLEDSIRLVLGMATEIPTDTSTAVGKILGQPEARYEKRADRLARMTSGREMFR